MSKGDNRRPGDDKAFSSNYDAIFGVKKAVRGSFVQDPKTGDLVPKDEYISPVTCNAPMVMNDISPYQSQIDGSIIGSRSTHREHLRQHGCIEIGNEKQQRKQIEPPNGLRDTIGRAVYQHLK